MTPNHLANMPWPARKRLEAIQALEAKAALGHSGSATPRDVTYTAGLLLAELPIDPNAAEHRLALRNALPPNWKAA
jgi:hypothetical protein